MHEKSSLSIIRCIEGGALNEFVADVSTIVQSQCERATDYADIETLVSQLPIDYLTFAAHDSYSTTGGPTNLATDPALVRRSRCPQDHSSRSKFL